MLKHNDIISRLSDAQKIRILANVGVLSDKDFKMLGIPGVKSGYMKDYCREKYPHAACIAHSWNTSLWAEVADAKVEEMIKDDVNLFITPGARVKLSPYRKEVSEDSHLAYRFAVAHAGSVGRYGGMGAQSGFYLTEADTDWLDTLPSDRVIGEQLVYPYVKATATGGSRAVMTDTRALPKEYDSTPRDMRSAVAGNVDYVICMQSTDENTVELIKEGVICLCASTNALESALSKYTKIKKQIDNGMADESRLLDEIKNNTAISPESVDEALDKVISFLMDCRDGALKMKSAPSREDKALAYRSALESTVLLKNKNDLLPLSQRLRLGIVGDMDSSGVGEGSLLGRCRDAFEARGYDISGICAGFDNDDIHNYTPKNDALKLADNSDAIILLLGIPRSKESEISKNETLSLPAQQLLLAHELAKKKKPVVVVISDAYTADIGFTHPFNALILSPLEAEGCVTALADIVSGRRNPSGKLAYTLYAESDTAFAKRSFYKKEYGIKSGPFVGYKYYDTAGIKVGYPFGHGLSYSQFKYSSLTVDGNKISFEIKNTSDVVGVEIVQIYAGMEKSSVIRPKKSLCGFARVTLEPGQTKKISWEIEMPKIVVNGQGVTEAGNYTVYVGSSVSDIRLQQTVSIKGVRVTSDGERLIDYIQSESNIKEDKFTLEANFSIMKKSYKNILFGVGAIVLAIAIAIFNTVMALSSTFLGIVTVLLAVVALVFFVMEANERNAKYEQERARIDAANREQFSGAKTVSNVSASRLFHAEFDAKDKAVVEETTQVDDYLDDKIAEYIDANFKFSDVAAEFAQFAAEKGYKFSKQSVENLLASMATTKLIITSMADEEFNACILLLSEYFGTEAFVDSYGVDANGNVDPFFTQDAKGDKSKKNIMLALAAASSAPEKIYISAIKGVPGSGLHPLISPLSRYINSQKEKNSIEIFNKAGANIGYTISPNLWFVINLAAGESVVNVPVSVVRSAAVNTLVFSKTKPSDSHSTLHGLNRYQLGYLAGKAGISDISEDMWKRFDKLERFAREYSDYRIGNKLWRSFEKHISLLISCGIDIAEAADMAMSTRLLPSVAVVINGKQAKEDPGLIDTVEFIFGSDNISASTEVVKTMLTDTRKTDFETDV